MLNLTKSLVDDGREAGTWSNASHDGNAPPHGRSGPGVDLSKVLIPSLTWVPIDILHRQNQDKGHKLVSWHNASCSDIISQPKSACLIQE